MSMIGTSIPRLRDAQLIQGRGCFTDDIHLDGLLEAHVLRSPHAHARIRQLNLEEARSHPDVVAVWGYNDLSGLLTEMPMIIPDRRIRYPKCPTLLADEIVRYVGQPVAFIVAKNRYVAEDAAALIAVEYEPLPVVNALRDAIDVRAALVHEDAKSNVAGSDQIFLGNVEAEIAAGPHVIRETFELARGHAQSLETRAFVARYDKEIRQLTVWGTTQAPIPLRALLSRMLSLDPLQVRVIAPDVGGGFGPKMAFYSEDVLVAYAAVRLLKPVKWVEDRLESFVATASEREQIHDVTVAFDNDGRLRALKDHFFYETGAFIPYGLNTPFVTATHLLGLYKIPSFAASFDAIFTNRMFCCPFRGAGRPYAAFVIERVMDRIAQELGLDPAEVRRRNLIAPNDIPYRYQLQYWDGGPIEFDFGDYPAMLNKALSLVDYDAIRQCQPRAWQAGRHLGVAVAVYCEMTGIGPYEGARVQVRKDGRIIVATGIADQGQGHHTTLAQIAADELGVHPEQVDVIVGDTASFGWGIGSFASRGAVTAGNAVRIAARRVVEQAKRWASDQLEAAVEDLDIVDGAVCIKGVAGRAISLTELATLADPSRGRIVQDTESFRPGLEADGYFNPAQGTMGAGVHACTVEVDAETGVVKVLNYVAVHDCGRIINPRIVDGQVIGGIALGIGGALYEKLAYDETGQLLTATYMDYLIPTATEIPPIVTAHLETPSPHNPLGVKGVGEAGTIPTAALIVSAVEDALKPFGVRLSSMPLAGPDAVYAAICQAKARRGDAGEMESFDAARTI